MYDFGEKNRPTRIRNLELTKQGNQELISKLTNGSEDEKAALKEYYLGPVPTIGQTWGVYLKELVSASKTLDFFGIELDTEYVKTRKEARRRIEIAKTKERELDAEIAEQEAKITNLLKANGKPEDFEKSAHHNAIESQLSTTEGTALFISVATVVCVSALKSMRQAVTKATGLAV